MHGLIFETSICYWQDQPDILLLSNSCVRVLVFEGKRKKINFFLKRRRYLHSTTRSVGMHRVSRVSDSNTRTPHTEPSPLHTSYIIYTCITLRVLDSSRPVSVYTYAHTPTTGQTQHTRTTMDKLSNPNPIPLTQRAREGRTF